MTIKNTKKSLFLTIMSVIFFVLWASAFANEQCLEFNDWDICLSISQDNNWYTVSTSVDNYNELPVVSCQVITPERVGAKIYYLPGCEGKFQYDWTDRGDLTFYLNYNESIETLNYDLRNESRDYLGWYDDEYYDNNNDYDNDSDYNYDDSYQSDDVKELYITVDDSTVDLYQRLDLYIKPKDIHNNTVDLYYETLNFTVYRQDTRWYYNEVWESYYWEKYRDYNISFNHQTYETLQDYFYFKQEWKYKIKIYQSDDLDVYGYVYIDVSDNRIDDNYDNDSESEVENFYVTVDDNTANVNQELDITIKARDDNNNTVYDYDETIRFRVYKENSNGNYSEVSSSYYNIDNTS